MYWLECIANLNSELERTCKTVKHSSLSRSGSIAHRVLRCKLGAGGSWAPAKLATWFDFRAGDRAHLWSTEAGRPAISPLARPTGALPRADWAASRVLSAGGHSPPSSSTAAARPPSSGALPARRLRTTTQSPCLSLCVSRPTDLDRACSI